ncbi:MAG: aspartate/glutamate racemase family protein [Alphaproteobacteria bacterium]
MKTVGIIGGLSPESTMLYYEGINNGVRARLGGSHNAHIIINSLDFGEFCKLKEQGDWEKITLLLCAAAKSLQSAGADFILLATNTMHKVADQIEESVSIPFIHLADSTARKIKESGVDCVGLLGTRYTMEQDFYKSRLHQHGLRVLIPNEEARKDIHNVIYDELCNGIINPKSLDVYKDVISEFENQGAQGFILGCTEITMLIKPEDVNLMGFDTTLIHIEDALKYMFED